MRPSKILKFTLLIFHSPPAPYHPCYTGTITLIQSHKTKCHFKCHQGLRDTGELQATSLCAAEATNTKKYDRKTDGQTDRKKLQQRGDLFVCLFMVTEKRCGRTYIPHLQAVQTCQVSAELPDLEPVSNNTNIFHAIYFSQKPLVTNQKIDKIPLRTQSRVSFPKRKI